MTVLVRAGRLGRAMLPRPCLYVEALKDVFVRFPASPSTGAAFCFQRLIVWRPSYKPLHRGPHEPCPVLPPLSLALPWLDKLVAPRGRAHVPSSAAAGGQPCAPSLLVTATPQMPGPCEPARDSACVAGIAILPPIPHARTALPPLCSLLGRLLPAQALPSDSEFALTCLECQERFHPKCIGLTVTGAKNLRTFTCALCLAERQGVPIKWPTRAPADCATGRPALGTLEVSPRAAGRFYSAVLFGRAMRSCAWKCCTG